MGCSGASYSSCAPPCFTSLLTSTITTFLFYILIITSTLSNTISIHSIMPNFTASYLVFIDNQGAFLASHNGSFHALIMNPTPGSRFFYFAVVHVPSKTRIWSANRNQPISESSRLLFTRDGITLFDQTHRAIWSTPPRLAPISSLQLLESGNLVLLDAMNNVIWESFDYPVDTLVGGQKLHIGSSLVSSSSDEDPSEGSYRMVIEDDDAILQWNGIHYWRLSMDSNAFIETSFSTEYLVMNISGMYLMGVNGSEIVIKLILQNPNGTSVNSQNFQVMKLAPNGLLSVISINGDEKRDLRLRFPVDSCRTPAICGTLGLCVAEGTCVCSTGFHHDFDTKNEGCVPIDASLALQGPCNGVSSSGQEIKYLNLSNNEDYFSNDFVDPMMHGMNLSNCQSLCSRNCSCLGIFHDQDSGSCYMIRDHLGSMYNKSILMSNINRVGYIKTIRVENPKSGSQKKKTNLSVMAAVLPLSLGATIIVLVVILVWLRRRSRRWGKQAEILKLNREVFTGIPGLPARFDYEELATITEGFRTKIGSGGFGTVYKGILEDSTNVAVKKINCLGAEGRREFLSEIATIGKIRHVNLVKLKGFCEHSGQRLLIYEYMNRGSLDQTLFHGETVLEWNERYKIAVGTARGLAYLHTECEHKIIHCDVKPENILLNDNLQVKVSDFGLSKLLSRELSGFFTTMRGTRGYIAPEWLTNTLISDKTDVYSYGMVLLEIIRGDRNFFSSSSSEEYGQRQINFPLRALEMHMERQYLELVDPRLVEKAPYEEVEKLVRVALCCVHREPNLRPSMSNVVRMLEGEMPLCEPKIDSLNFLRCYSTEESAVNNEQNEYDLQRQEMSSTNRLDKSLSYLSSQQVSGPR